MHIASILLGVLGGVVLLSCGLTAFLFPPDSILLWGKLAVGSLMVLAAVLLHRVAPDKAREFLAELETEPEIIEAVLELLAGQGAERDLNRQIFQDVMALLEEKTGITRQFSTRTAQRLAATKD